MGVRWSTFLKLFLWTEQEKNEFDQPKGETGNNNRISEQSSWGCWVFITRWWAHMQDVNSLCLRFMTIRTLKNNLHFNVDVSDKNKLINWIKKTKEPFLLKVPVSLVLSLEGEAPWPHHRYSNPNQPRAPCRHQVYVSSPCACECVMCVHVYS